MAAVRARRNGGGRGRGRTYAPPPAVPKLAYMKLEGAHRVAESLQALRSPRKLGLMLAGGVLMLGVAAAGAVWIGGSLMDTREALAGAADRAASYAGFGVKSIAVTGVAGVRADDVRAAALPPGRTSLFSAAPTLVRARVQRLDWVEDARVKRLWPSTLRIDVKRRKAYALWRVNSEAIVIDENGAPLSRPPRDDMANLPVIVGPGAARAAPAMIEALEGQPAIRARLQAAVRVGDRRWDLKLKSGAVVALPEENAPAAVAMIGALDARYQILDRPLARIDLRQPGRLIALPRARRQAAAERLSAGV